MKVYLKRNGLFWTGHIGSLKDGSNIFFVTTPDKLKAKDLGTEDNALSQLEWWCNQCGAEPKEWTLEIEQEENFCEKIKRDQQYKEIHDSVLENIKKTYSRFECKQCRGTGRDGVYACHNCNGYGSVDYSNYSFDLYAVPVPEYTNGTLRYVPEVLDEELRKSTNGKNTNSMQRTLNEICKDADYYYDDSVKLFNLIEEVKSGDLSESQSGFALDYINEKIETLKDNIRKQRVRNRFDED